MPIGRYDRFFGGEKGSAQEAKSAMESQYGSKKGEQVFYAKKNKNKSAGRVTGPGRKPHFPSSQKRD